MTAYYELIFGVSMSDRTVKYLVDDKTGRFIAYRENSPGVAIVSTVEMVTELNKRADEIECLRRQIKNLEAQIIASGPRI